MNPDLDTAAKSIFDLCTYLDDFAHRRDILPLICGRFPQWRSVSIGRTALASGTELKTSLNTEVESSWKKRRRRRRTNLAT